MDLHLKDFYLLFLNTIQNNTHWEYNMATVFCVKILECVHSIHRKLAITLSLQTIVNGCIKIYTKVTICKTYKETSVHIYF